MQEQEIRVQILEQMFEYHRRELTLLYKSLEVMGDHYTYRDSIKAHQIASEWIKREHMGILKYTESAKRIREIEDRIAEHVKGEG